MFHNLISDLLDSTQLIEIAIDSNEPEPGAPSVSIITPKHNQTISQPIVHIVVNTSDAETDTQDLQVNIRIDIPGFHSYLLPAHYDESTQEFYCDFNISFVKNNTPIIIQVYATDSENKTGISSPVYAIIINAVYYSKWLPIGWNEIQFPQFITNTSIHHIFSTIFDSFYIIFELETGDYYIKNQDFNTLETITPGNTYWVKMIQEDELYLHQQQ
jgi:hypothetical protein